MIKTILVDGHGSGNRAKINGEGELNIVQHTHPPIRELVEVFPYRQYFTTTAGASDMRVNGATTNVEFCLRASPTRDIWVKTISVIIADAGARLNQFGALAALTNGVKFSYNNQGLGEVVIHEALKTNLNFLRLGTSSPPIGGTNAFKADLSGGGADAYLPVIDMANAFGMNYGLRLRKGTLDKICFTVRDNLSVGLDQFDIIGYGIQI